MVHTKRNPRFCTKKNPFVLQKTPLLQNALKKTRLILKPPPGGFSITGGFLGEGFFGTFWGSF